MGSNSRVSVLGQSVSGSSAVERAQNASAEAKRLEKIGEYQAAYEVLAEYWPDRQAFPKLPDLPKEIAADLMLRIGALSCWLGSADQTGGSQELGKDIINRALLIYETLELPAKVAEARGDMGLCYWREGAFDEARVQFSTALGLVPAAEHDLKAMLLIRSGIVEGDAHRLNTALAYYNEALPLVEESSDDALKGGFHFSYALLFKRLAAPENREDYIDRALVEYTAASVHFERAGNVRAQARVEANLGNLFCMIGRYADAHRHLDRARGLLVSLDDAATLAVIDETRARTLLGEGRLVEADRMIKMSVKVLEKGDQQAVLAEALTTFGVVQARLGYHARAKVLFDRAINVAETMNEPEEAGRAKLCVIEELRDKLPEPELVEIYWSARELLRHAEDQDVGKRLIDGAGVLLKMLLERDAPVLNEPDTFDGFSIKRYLKDAERKVIRRALREAEGSVTRAAHLLGFKHHQSLINLINSRHRQLINERSTVRKRKRTIIRQGKQSSEASRPSKVVRRRALYVGDHNTLGNMVGTELFQGIDVQSFGALQQAIKAFGELASFDIVIIGPGFEGPALVAFLEALRRVQHHGPRVPIAVMGQRESEDEVWRVGVDTFVAEDEKVSKLVSDIERILKESKRE